ALAAYDKAIRWLADPQTGEGVRAVAAAAEARMLGGRYGESRRLAEEALTLARTLGLPLEEAEILGTLGVDLAFLGDAGPADAAPVIAAALADRPTGAAAIELLLARARLAVGRGDFAAAHADLERVDHRWTQAVAPRYRAPLLTLSAGLALWEGRLDDAREAV